MGSVVSERPYEQVQNQTRYQAETKDQIQSVEGRGSSVILSLKVNCYFSTSTQIHINKMVVCVKAESDPMSRIPTIREGRIAKTTQKSKQAEASQQRPEETCPQRTETTEPPTNKEDAEFLRLKCLLPQVAKKSVSRLDIVLEAITYIDHLQDQLLDKVLAAEGGDTDRVLDMERGDREVLMAYILSLAVERNKEN